MIVRALQCVSCGGAIANQPGESTPRCLFCGRAELVAINVPETVEAPAGWLPFAVDEAAATQGFRAWAKSRFWAPNAIRGARVELSRLFLPAWIWAGQLETHWTGLVRAGTRSGKRPVTGQHTAELSGVLVPSSPALSASELSDISPFSHGAERPYGTELPAPQEVGTLTRSIARQRGVAQMEARHGSLISAAEGLLTIRTSSLVLHADGRPVLLPIWIGAYVHGDDSYRVVINGQTGAVTGTSPISWMKVAVAAVAGIFAILMLIAVLANA